MSRVFFPLVFLSTEAYEEYKKCDKVFPEDVLIGSTEDNKNYELVDHKNAQTFDLQIEKWDGKPVRIRDNGDSFVADPEGPGVIFYDKTGYLPQAY